MTALTTRVDEYKSGTGTISSSTTAASVTGSGTLFTSELYVGYVLKDSVGNIVGTVNSITNDTQLYLVSNAAVNLNNDTYSYKHPNVSAAGVALTNTEVDSNFINLNNDKLERTANLADLPNKVTARANLGVTIGTHVQAYDADLTGLSALNSTGIVVRTADNTYANRTILGTTNDIDITNGSGAAGNISLVLGSNVPKLNASTNIFSGDIQAANFNATSDRNLKTRVASIEGALNIVNQLDGRSFKWVSSGKDSFGVIAQEIEEILPQLVEYRDGVKSVNYLGIIGFLINAVKELDEKVKNLESQ